MQSRKPVAGAKALIQRVEAMIRATLPRQAHVTRNEGRGVWVRFIGESTSDPDSHFPSNVVGVPPGTVGWVIALGGKKGLFIVTGISLPQTLYARGGGAQTISTAGDYAKEGVALTFTNLSPYRQYIVDVDIDIRCWASTGTASGYPGVIVEHAGGTSPIPTAMNPPILGTDRNQLTWSSAENFMPKPDGTLTVKPGVRWFSGSILMGGTSIKATVS